MADELGLQTILKQFGVKEIKPKQKKNLDTLLTNKNCMAVLNLPTGFGQSLPYELLVPLKKAMGVMDGVFAASFLMQDQFERLKNIPDVKAVYLGGSHKDTEVESGNFDYLFAAPETLVGDQHWRFIIQQFEVSSIIIDEFHTIATWWETFFFKFIKLGSKNFHKTLKLA